MRSNYAFFLHKVSSLKCFSISDHRWVNNNGKKLGNCTAWFGYGCDRQQFVCRRLDPLYSNVNMGDNF